MCLADADFQSCRMIGGWGQIAVAGPEELFECTVRRTVSDSGSCVTSFLRRISAPLQISLSSLYRVHLQLGASVRRAKTFDLSPTRCVF